jgi:hypothetical protein
MLVLAITAWCLLLWLCNAGLELARYRQSSAAPAAISSTVLAATQDVRELEVGTTEPHSLSTYLHRRSHGSCVCRTWMATECMICYPFDILGNILVCLSMEPSMSSNSQYPRFSHSKGEDANSAYICIPSPELTAAMNRQINNCH